MNLLEKKIVDLLTALKENYHVTGIKTEPSAECLREKELLLLKELTAAAGLDLFVKIGGCEAIKDICDAKTVNAKAIIAPVIESAYAAEKFVKSYKSVCPDEKEGKNTKLLINIETICGYKNLDEILTSPFINNITGIVFGRSDMAKSLGFCQNDVNNEQILKYAQKIAGKSLNYNKELTIGGGICPSSLPFLKKLQKNSLTSFETKKVIFASQALYYENATEGIIKAFELELVWFQNKQEYSSLSEIDTERIKVIEKNIKI